MRKSPPEKFGIYFSGSISGGRGDQGIYEHLISHLQTHGRVLTEHVGSAGLEHSGEHERTNEEIFHRDIDWLRAADCVIAEVTTPSLGVGYEIARAVEMAKPTLCLFRDDGSRRLSAMIAGNPDVVNATYVGVEDACAHIDRFLANRF